MLILVGTGRMPKLSVQIYCDAKPENLTSFQGRLQKFLLGIDSDYILVAADYSEDDEDIEDLLLGALQSTNGDLYTNPPVKPQKPQFKLIK